MMQTGATFARLPVRRAASRQGLAADALFHSGGLRMRVYGESMLPALWPGDIVEIESCKPQDVRSGDIVLAFRDDRFFLHRLIWANENGFMLRGDSIPGCDPLYPAEAFLGRLAASSAPNRPFNAGVYRFLGFLLCRFTLLRRVALRLHSWGVAARMLPTSPESVSPNPAEVPS